MRNFLTLFVLSVLTFNMLFAYSGGSGTKDDPYQIATFEDLIQLSDSSSDWDKYFIQTADINMAKTREMNIENGDTLGFSPIGNKTNKFSGSYDGNYFIIDSLYINRPSEENIGFIGYARYAKIKNIRLLNAEIYARNMVGVMIGYDINGTISRCYSNGKVTGVINYSTTAGGLIGRAVYSNISLCFSSGKVTGNAFSGGLIGDVRTNTIVDNCFSGSTVYNRSGWSSGGLIGSVSDARVSNCYSYGSVHSNYPERNSGLIGKKANSTIVNCFWDSTASGIKISAGGTAKSTDEMKTADTYTDLGIEGLEAAWDFIGKMNDDAEDNDIWVMSSGNSGYPSLAWYDSLQGGDSLFALVSTDSLRDITTESLTIYGNIAHFGTSNPTQHGFCWSSGGVPDINDNTTNEGAVSAVGDFSSRISGLTEGNTYYFRAYAVNEIGVSYGKVIKYSMGKAVVVFDSLGAFADTSVSGFATMESSGASELVKLGFCWNTSGNPDTTDNKTEENLVGSGAGFSSVINGLKSGRVYFIRAYAVNASGIAYSEEISFVAHKKPEGEGTEENPYKICSLGTIYWLAENSDVWDKEFVQTNDINAAETKNWNEGKGYLPIGNDGINFKGKYHGQMHNIDSLIINRPDQSNLGFFGQTSDALIDSLSITNVYIDGRSQSGALVGYGGLGTIIKACYTSGDIATVYSNVGGIVGYLYYSEIYDSYSKANIKDGSNGGGLVGNANNSTLSNCYASGSVNGRNYLGGLIGFFRGTYAVKGLAKNCYSRGRVTGLSVNNIGGLIGNTYNGVVQNCFWDSTASGMTVSAAGTAKSTREMKNYYTYTDTLFSAGLDSAWDFIGNVNDDQGNENIWDMDQSGSGYPILSWQKEADDILNTPPTLSSLPDTISFSTDSSAVVNIWDFANDPDMPDSLLNYSFSVSYDSIHYSFDKSSGFLTLSSDGSFVGTARLVIEIADYVETVKDSIIIKVTPVITGIAEKGAPIVFSLSQNYPNPFNPTTTIEFSLPEANDVKLVFYNTAGERIKTVEMGVKQPGSYKYVWNAKNDMGRVVSSGVYFYKITAGKYHAIKKIVFMK